VLSLSSPCHCFSPQTVWLISASQFRGHSATGPTRVIRPAGAAHRDRTTVPTPGAGAGRQAVHAALPRCL
jgi:hypothetical protein